MHARTHAHTHTHTHTHTRTYIHTYIHIHTRMHARTHTHNLFSPLSLSFSHSFPKLLLLHPPPTPPPHSTLSSSIPSFHSPESVLVTLSLSFQAQEPHLSAHRIHRSSNFSEASHHVPTFLEDFQNNARSRAKLGNHVLQNRRINLYSEWSRPSWEEVITEMEMLQAGKWQLCESADNCRWQIRELHTRSPHEKLWDWTDTSSKPAALPWCCRVSLADWQHRRSRPAGSLKWCDKINPTVNSKQSMAATQGVPHLTKHSGSSVNESLHWDCSFARDVLTIYQELLFRFVRPSFFYVVAIAFTLNTPPIILFEECCGFSLSH